MKLSPEHKISLFAVLALAVGIPFVAFDVSEPFAGAPIGIRTPLYFAVIALTIAAYFGFGRDDDPAARRSHRRFMQAAGAGCVGAMLLERSFIGDGFSGMSGDLAAMAFMFAVVGLAFFLGCGYTGYRLTLALPERYRRRVAGAFALALCLGIMPYGIGGYHEVTRLRCLSVLEEVEKGKPPQATYPGLADQKTHLQKFFHTPEYSECRHGPNGLEPVDGAKVTR